MTTPELIGYYIGAIIGALLVNLLLSSVLRWLIKKINPKASHTTKNVIACSVVPAIALFNQPADIFIITLAFAVIVFIVHQQTDKKSSSEHS